MIHTISVRGDDTEPAALLLWQVEFIRMLQNGIDVSPNLLRMLLWLGSPLVMGVIAMVWSILIDFSGGMGMLAVQCEAIIASRIAQNLLKLPRPYWISEDLLLSGTVPTACAQSKRFGFPSEQVVLFATVFTYFAMYVSEHSERWSAWFENHDSTNRESRQRSLWMRVMAVVLVISALGMIFVLAESIAVLYTGISFVHDVIAAVLLGFSISVFQVSVIQPLCIFPMCRYSLRASHKRGLFLPMFYSFFIGGLVPFVLSLGLYFLGRMSISKPEWESTAQDHCGPSYHIAGESLALFYIFKASGVLCGICISFCPLLVNFVPVHLTFRRAGMSGLAFRIAGFAILGAPLILVFALFQVFVIEEIRALEKWWLEPIGIILDFFMYAMSAIWIFVFVPFLLNLCNERSISMRITHYERLVHFKREPPHIPLIQHVRRSSSTARRAQPLVRPSSQSGYQQEQVRRKGYRRPIGIGSSSSP